MTPEGFLLSKGFEIATKDSRKIVELLQEYAEHYHAEKLKALPGEEMIDAEAAEYSKDHKEQVAFAQGMVCMRELIQKGAKL